MKLKATEQQIFNAILDWLTVMRIPHAKVRNTGTIIKRDGKTIFGRSKRDQRGVPDILLCYRGHAVGIEVKSEKGVPSPEQEEWHAKWRNAGGHILVARHLETVINFIAALERNQKV